MRYEHPMEEMFFRLWIDLADRVGGPMSFRLILQPLAAAVLAFRAGLRDARLREQPFLVTLIFDSVRRRGRAREAWQAIARIFVFAIAIDAIYQLWILEWFYPLEALVTAFVLAVVPYALLRGPVNVLARRLRKQ
jgi:hypothetical protein